jgi:rRNA pseudouridine-1189 N-methylase Emg1 (Nep1/Mra1 family)
MVILNGNVGALVDLLKKFLVKPFEMDLLLDVNNVKLTDLLNDMV